MSDGSKWGISGEQGPELPVNPRAGRRTLADIEAHADELAQRFMDYEPLTLTAFLLARIAEDEASAQAKGSWWTGLAEGDEVVFEWHPTGERDLREAQAKRLLVEGVQAFQEGSWARMRSMRPPWLGPEETTWAGDIPYVLRCLSLPYADHADYQEEWKP